MRRVLPVAAVLIVALAGFVALWALRDVSRVQGKVQSLEWEIESLSDARPFVRVRNRVYPRQPRETRAEWIVRIQDLLAGDDVEPGGFQCTTLTGCRVPGGEIEVCTPLGGDHQADVDAFCEAFRCTDCGDE